MRSIFLLLAFAAPISAAHIVVRPNHHDEPRTLPVMELSGIGIVTGLAGTGGNSNLTRVMVFQWARRAGLNPKPVPDLQKKVNKMNTASIAVVFVTATMPNVVGQKYDVRVTAIDDATDLHCGVLMPVRLIGPDGKEYATAQGPLSVTSFMKKTKSVIGVIRGGAEITNHSGTPAESLRE